MIFHQKWLWNIRSRPNSSTFWVFEPVFKYVWSKSTIFCAQSLNFDQTSKYRPKNSKCGRVSLDLIIHNNFWWNIRTLSKQNSKLIINSKPDRNQSKLTVWTPSGHESTMAKNMISTKVQLKPERFYENIFFPKNQRNNSKDFCPIK